MASASHFIPYVADQNRREICYNAVLDISPRLQVPGMIEYDLPGGGMLGFMPENSIRRLIELSQIGTYEDLRFLRAQLYLLGDESATYLARVRAAVAREASPLLGRVWGQTTVYSFDPTETSRPLRASLRKAKIDPMLPRERNCRPESLFRYMSRQQC